MTIDSLTPIEAGTEADAVALNNNFIYLDEKIEAKIDAIKGGETNATLISTNSRVDAVNSYMQSGGAVPVGTIIMFGAATPPTGYLPCDGRPLSKSDTLYGNLFSVIQYTYGGSGDTFNLPNFNNRYPKGAGDSAVGTYGRPVLAEHSHTYYDNSTSAYAVTTPNVTYYPMPGATGACTGVGNSSTAETRGSYGAVIYHPQDWSAETGAYVQAESNEPWNLAVLYCIKY